jgi:hypothetical protein
MREEGSRRRERDLIAQELRLRTRQRKDCLGWPFLRDRGHAGVPVAARALERLPIVVGERTAPALVERVQRPVIRVLRAVENADAQTPQPGPIQAAWQPAQTGPRTPADDPLPLATIEEPLDELQLLPLGLGCDL